MRGVSRVQVSMAQCFQTQVHVIRHLHFLPLPVMKPEGWKGGNLKAGKPTQEPNFRDEYFVKLLLGSAG